MDANEEMAVKIVRDCLTTARESLPLYVSRLWVRDRICLQGGVCAIVGYHCFRFAAAMPYD